jgi:2-polyprenyl-6-methoxyphenol hydroxylase-like FAD-dependent oxidoreductase
MLERIGVSKRLAGLGIHAWQFSIRDGDRELVPVRFDRLPTEYPYTLMVPQSITEKVLLDRLEDLGGRVHRPYVAAGVSQTVDDAQVTLDSGHVIKAEYVVAADGGSWPKSTMRRSSRTWRLRSDCSTPGVRIVQGRG